MVVGNRSFGGDVSRKATECFNCPFRLARNLPCCFHTHMSARVNVGSRVETKTSFIKELIGDIQKGEIKIPQFQRKFVWKETQALNLLDSIINNYPVGSILLWRTNTKLAVE